MKYTPEITAKLIKDYQDGMTVAELTSELQKQTGQNETIPERSVIAKLSSLGVYKRKVYVNKRGDTPIKKEEYIDRIAALLNIDPCLLESMEKVTKSALILIEKQVKELNK